MAKGYWIARVDVADAEAYKAYVAANAAPLARFGARFIVRAGRFENPEGASRSRNVVVEFPSYQAALDCWKSADYQAAVQLRLPVSTVDMVIVEGYDGQPGTAGSTLRAAAPHAAGRKRAPLSPQRRAGAGSEPISRSVPSAPGATTTISAVAGLRPVRARMFSPWVTTSSTPGPRQRPMTARPRSRSASRRSPRTKALAKAGSTWTGPTPSERRGVDAAAPRRAEHAGDRDSLGAQAGADSTRLVAASLAEVALGRAVVEAPAFGIADAGRVAVAHQRDDAALAQRRPGGRLVGARRRAGRDEQEQRAENAGQAGDERGRRRGRRRRVFGASTDRPSPVVV